jgi:hypothetical protein
MTQRKLTLEWTQLDHGARALIFDADTWAAFEKSAQTQGKTAQQMISTAVAASFGTIMTDNYSLNRFLRADHPDFLRFQQGGDVMKRAFATALFTLFLLTAPAHAATIFNLDLDFGNGYQEIGNMEIGSSLLEGYQGCCLTLYYNGAPLSPFHLLGGGIPPIPNSVIGLYDIGGSPVGFVLALSNTQNFPYLDFTDFSLNGVPAVSGEVSIVPLPAALPLFGSGVITLAGFAWRKRRFSNDETQRHW